MKTSALLCICIAVWTVSGVPVDEYLENYDYSQIIEVQDEDGLTFTIDLGATPDMERNLYNNRYSLFTRKNPTEAQDLSANSEAVNKASNFDAELPTVVLVHGWLKNQGMAMTANLRDAFLEKEDVNFVVVDWALLAAQDYITASAGTTSVGQGIANFLQFLQNTTEARYESMHLVGFSLGAHAVGIAGRQLEGKVARITGLDPAGPLWSISPNKLNKDDAVYVEVIHTHGGINGLGIGMAVGDVDFFPNGGAEQPGCFTTKCEHNRAWNLFVATIRYNHLIGRECANLLQITLNTCRGPTLFMGGTSLTKTGAGMFRVNTGRVYPY